MCGIVCCIGVRPKIDIDEWVGLSKYRGPDNTSVWQDHDIILGHNRLAIIDLKSESNQPFFSDDKRYVIVFNGEIYNYKELRQVLVTKGMHFNTDSDTEVLLKGYMLFGKKILDLLDGMFAFAIWDRTEKKIFLARDHVGMKPLFYSKLNGGLIVSSELKSIILSGLLHLEPDENSIREYLAYSYIPAPNSGFKNIRTMSPGTYIEYSKGQEINEVVWWNFTPNTDIGAHSFDEAKLNVRKLLSKSVKKRMISDVPVGAFLSGGLDSSAIVAEMAMNSSSRIKAVSIGYKGNPDYDESSYAQLVANKFNVDHNVLYPNFDSKYIQDYLDILVNQFDQPYGNPNQGNWFRIYCFSYRRWR